MPEDAFKAIKSCDSSLYPNIATLPNLFLVTPTTSCEPERVFSQLKNIKTATRSTMSQDRLSNMMLLKIHPDIPIDIKKITQAVISSSAE